MKPLQFMQKGNWLGIPDYVRVSTKRCRRIAGCWSYEEAHLADYDGVSVPLDDEPMSLHKMEAMKAIHVSREAKAKT